MLFRAVLRAIALRTDISHMRKWLRQCERYSGSEGTAVARSKEDLDKWQAFASLINKMIKEGHGEKVAIGLTGALMGQKTSVDAMFEWADVYFKDEIEASFMKMMGPRDGETIH